MASRPILPPFPVIVDGDMAAASITSLPTIMTNLSIISYQLVWTGSSPVGVAALEVSNNYSINMDGSVRDAGDWVTATSATVTGSTGTGFFNFSDQGQFAVRLKYTKTSGTGTLQVIAAGKVS